MTTTIPGARLFAAACALILAGCGAEQAAPETPAAPAAVVPAAAPEAPAPVAATARVDAPAAPSRDAAPSRADSAAAAAEDVSPEWKQRERAMAGTEQCLRQAAELPADVRARVESACRARPRS